MRYGMLWESYSWSCFPHPTKIFEILKIFPIQPQDKTETFQSFPRKRAWLLISDMRFIQANSSTSQVSEPLDYPSLFHCLVLTWNSTLDVRNLSRPKLHRKTDAFLRKVQVLMNWHFLTKKIIGKFSTSSTQSIILVSKPRFSKSKSGFKCPVDYVTCPVFMCY